MNPHSTEPKNRRQRLTLILLDHLRQYARSYLLLAIMLLAILVYYWFEWRTFKEFVVAIDHHSQFLQDFVGHYYPMSRQILQVPTPVEGYFYTSFFALILTPIGTLAPLPAMVIWGAIQFACLVALILISTRGLLKLSPLGMVLYTCLCVTSFPILHNTKWGQVSVLITACVMASFLSLDKNKHVLAGILLAFATAIKFYPLIFIVFFVLKRDVRACIAFGLAAFIFYLAFPVTVLGFSDWLGFEKATSIAINNTEWEADVNSQYIVHVGLRWFAFIFDQAAGGALAQTLTIIGYAIALSCIVMIWLLQRRAIYEKHALAVVAIFLSIPFVIKTSWPHYLVYLPFCQAAVFSYYASIFRTLGLRGKVLIVLPTLSILLSSVFFFNLFPDWSKYNSHGMLFLANLLLLFALYGAIAMHRHPLAAESQRIASG